LSDDTTVIIKKGKVIMQKMNQTYMNEEAMKPIMERFDKLEKLLKESQKEKIIFRAKRRYVKKDVKKEGEKK